MSLILLIPILVSGFLYCNTRYTQYIKLHRYQGQYLYLKSVKYGLFSVLTSIALISCFHHLFSLESQHFNDFLSQHIASITPANPDTSFIASCATITVLSMLVSIFSGLFLNFTNLVLKTGFPMPLSCSNTDRKLFSLIASWHESVQIHWYKTKLLLSCDILSDSPLDQIFIDSYTRVEEILITTDSDKVYVGFIANLAEPNESKGFDQEIQIIPTCSGYRDPITKKVIFNTYYPSEDTNSYIVIRQDLIISASPFSQEIYDKVNKSTSIHGPLSA